MTTGSSPRDVFREFAREVLPQGVSGNLIIRGAIDAGIGIRRQDALGILRELRQASETALPVVFEVPQLTPETGAPAFKWGELSQATDQWTAFDGPTATMFQQLGPNSNEWLDYIVTPEEDDFISFRFVVADDEYVSGDGRNPGFRTSQSFDASVSLADAASRLGINQDDIARVIYDKP